MRGQKKQLSQFQKVNINLLILKGYTIRQIAEVYNVPYTLVSTSFKLQLENKLQVPLYFNSKNEPYYEDEDDYGTMPEYNYHSLCISEKIIFYNSIKNELKNVN